MRGIGDATFYTWKSKHGGPEVSDGKRLRALEAENARLKRLLAEAMRRTPKTRSITQRLWFPVDESRGARDAFVIPMPLWDILMSPRLVLVDNILERPGTVGFEWSGVS